jgi:hypothetical protein
MRAGWRHPQIVCKPKPDAGSIQAKKSGLTRKLASPDGAIGAGMASARDALIRAACMWCTLHVRASLAVPVKGPKPYNNRQLMVLREKTVPIRSGIHVETIKKIICAIKNLGRNWESPFLPD